MRILFITPPYSIAERYHTKAKITKGFLPPLGLASIATVLKENGHTVRILDLPVLNYTLEQLKNYVKEFQPELIAFAAITPTMDKAARIAGYLKPFTNAVYIFGGLHPSLFPEETLKTVPLAEIVVIGEAEHTFAELADKLEKKQPIHDVAGICYRDNGHIKRTAPRKLITNLNDLPIPSREFFDMRKYMPLPNQYKRLPATNMLTARGCPYAKCTFCFEAGDHKPIFRRITPERAVAEIKMLVDTYGIKEISFWDDVFLVGQQWMQQFHDGLKKENIDITWSCYGYFPYLNKEILKLAKASGCWNIFYGIEAGNQQLLNTIKKGFTKEQAKQALQWTHELGIETRGSFILGLPGETPALAKETVDFAIECDLDYAQFTLNTPFPSTEMWKTGDQYGTIDKNYDDYSVHNPVYLPKGYANKQELINMQKYAYRKFYLRPQYAWKHLKRIRSFNDVHKYAAGFKFLLGMN